MGLESRSLFYDKVIGRWIFLSSDALIFKNDSRREFAGCMTVYWCRAFIFNGHHGVACLGSEKPPAAYLYFVTTKLEKLALLGIRCHFAIWRVDVVMGRNLGLVLFRRAFGM